MTTTTTRGIVLQQQQKRKDMSVRNQLPSYHTTTHVYPDLAYDVVLFCLRPMQNSATHATSTINMSAVAAHVSAKNLPPRCASTPTSLPYLLIKLVALTMTAVTSALASPMATNASVASIKLRHADSLPEVMTANSAASSATKMRQMAMMYSTNMAAMSALSA
jgi:hypothetical protein